MQTVIEAVFENGVLRPLAKPALEEHRSYRLIIEDQAPNTILQKRGVPDRARELDWLRQHRHEYRGQYIALSGDRLLAHGMDGETVLQTAHEAGEPLPYIVHVETEEEANGFWGGWL